MVSVVLRCHSSANVFVNKNTKVICQGMTGKHVGGVNSEGDLPH